MAEGTPISEEEQREIGNLIGGYAGSPGFILGYNTILKSPLQEVANAADRQFRRREQVRMTSLDMYEYFIALTPEQLEPLAKALFIEGYTTFTNNVDELYDPEIVFAGILDVMDDLAAKAGALGVTPEAFLKVTDNPDEFIPQMDRKFKETDLDLFEEKIAEAEKGLVTLPDMRALETQWQAQSVATLGFDVSKTNPDQFRNFVSGMRRQALDAQERGENYEVGAQMTHALETQNPGATAFMEHENVQDRFMTWAAGQR
jgi:hypothetical protein